MWKGELGELRSKRVYQCNQMEVAMKAHEIFEKNKIKMMLSTNKPRWLKKSKNIERSY